VLNEAQIVEAYRLTIRPLYAYISRRVGGDPGLAEDLVQDTWMRALDTWPSRGVPDEPLAWLTRVAHNTLVSHFRRIRPVAVDAGVLELIAAPAAVDDETARVISWGLARLRRPHAELLEAQYFDDKSVADIARERGMSERAVEGRLRRARAKLKKTLERVLPRRAPARDRAHRERIEHARHTRP
jgi:RNA polymerase sigma factor (sigma-70 family)